MSTVPYVSLSVDMSDGPEGGGGRSGGVWEGSYVMTRQTTQITSCCIYLKNSNWPVLEFPSETRPLKKLY